jgi:hypothetical protein
MVGRKNSIPRQIERMFLLALECYDLGRVAYTNGDFYHTLMWMQEALSHLEDETTKESIGKIDILDHLAYATSQVNYRSNDVHLSHGISSFSKATSSTPWR